MLKIFIKTLIIILFLIVTNCKIYSQQDKKKQSINIDGVYEFVSETTALKKPQIILNSRTHPQWSGLYNFQSGYFSITLVDESRSPDWVTKFPENAAQLGFDSVAGKYEIKENLLILKPQVFLYPLYGSQIRTFEIKIDNNNLTLVEKITPYPENISEGERITNLRRAKTIKNVK